MVTGLLFSAVPPFYPSEALARGLGPHRYGLAFAAAHLATLLAWPAAWRFSGQLVGWAKLVLVVASCCQVMFLKC